MHDVTADLFVCSEKVKMPELQNLAKLSKEDASANDILEATMKGELKLKGISDVQQVNLVAFYNQRAPALESVVPLVKTMVEEDCMFSLCL